LKIFFKIDKVVSDCGRWIGFTSKPELVGSDNGSEI